MVSHMQRGVGKHGLACLGGDVEGQAQRAVERIGKAGGRKTRQLELQGQDGQGARCWVPGAGGCALPRGREAGMRELVGV